MKKMMTKHFGEIEYDPARAISFPQGIPGLPEDTEYLLMSENANEDTFFWLQSLQNGDIAFTLMNVYDVIPTYDPKVDEEQLVDLGEIGDNNLEIYNIVVIPEYVRHMRVNLKAPVVINSVAGLGKQVICTNEDYPIRYMIFEELERARKEKAAMRANAGTDT